MLVEGFKHGAHPKLEIFRAALGKPPLAPDDPHIVAVAADTPQPRARVPVLALDDLDGIVATLLARAVPLDMVIGFG